MYELKKIERYLRVNLLGPRPRLMKKEFTGPRSHKGWETLLYTMWGNSELAEKLLAPQEGLFSVELFIDLVI